MKLDEPEECIECGVTLKPGQERWLEMDSRDAKLYEPGEVPQEHSQGCYPIGSCCCKKIGRTGWPSGWGPTVKG